MPFTPLSAQQHQNLKIADNAAISAAARQHMVSLRVTDIPQAVCNFPVFFSRHPQDGRLAISALTSITVNTNLFVQNNQWQALYTPATFGTYPVFLINAEGKEKGYDFGIDPVNPAFSEEQGEALFNSDGSDSNKLKSIKQQLEAGLTQEAQTRSFCQALDELGLIRAVDLLVSYADNTRQNVQGLLCINEEKLNSLPAEQMQLLFSRGYLIPIHAMLISVYQVNAIIRRHNAIPGNTQVTGIKIEVAKDRTLS